MPPRVPGLDVTVDELAYLVRVLAGRTDLQGLALFRRASALLAEVEKRGHHRRHR
jgi:hypothetical protein